jgi:hypothetical protein
MNVGIPTPEMISEYRSLIGSHSSIGFAVITVRFDIAYAVSVFSRHLARPCRKVINQAKRCIRYLIGTRDFTVRRSTHPDSLADNMRNILWASADASYAADPITRRRQPRRLYRLPQQRPHRLEERPAETRLPVFSR